MFAPGLVLGEDAGEVQGLVFTSGALPAHWSRLDAFEGEGHVWAFVYALSAVG